MKFIADNKPEWTKLNLFEWQPIETAPRDQTHILVFTHDGMTTAYSHGGCLWHGVISADYDNPMIIPTHWMPLPEPPK